MKIVVVGGSGLIGEKLVYNLRQDDLMVVEASPTYGVDTVTGEGLEAALDGAEVVVDVSNSPSFEGVAAQRFFGQSGRRLLAAAAAAGVRHHIVLSIVGTDGLQTGGYFRAKKLQEDLLKASGLPYTILRSTQFFEFIAGVVQDGDSERVIVPTVWVQPIAGLEVAEVLADLATGDPVNGAVEVAGPERFRLPELAAEVLTAYEDPRRLVPSPDALYFGARVGERSLLPGPQAHIATLGFEDWLRRTLEPWTDASPLQQNGLPS